MKKTGLLLMLLFFTKNTFAQNYILPNEKVVFSFITKNCKKMVLAKDKNNNYLIYRFGSTQKIELEYPKDKNMLSWSKFRFSFYLRGGGVQNEAMDLNGLHFEIDNFKYSLYQNYYAAVNQKAIGLRLTNLKTHKIIDIKGKNKTLKGNLYDFRDNELVKIDKDRID